MTTLRYPARPLPQAKAHPSVLAGLLGLLLATAFPLGAGDANRLSWSTASETDNFGYDVYRSESPEGPFERVTASPIPGAGTTDMPSRYEYRDDSADPSNAYWYYVESISIQGKRKRFTPVRGLPPRGGAGIEAQDDRPDDD